MTPKTVIFFIDGGTWELLNPWMAQGHLPNFKRVRDSGVSGIMQSTVPPSTVPAIQAFHTGRNPGYLGIFNVVKPDGSVVSFKDVKEKTMWEILGEHGFESLITELPTTYPPRPFNGRMITGFLTPSRESGFTWPPELKEQLGDYPAGLEYDHSSTLKQKDDRHMLDSIIEISRKRFETFMRLYREKPPAFAIFYVKSTDILGHLLWDKRDLLLEYYKLLDRELGEIMVLAGASANIMITSDHGFEDAATHGFYVNTWLAQHGYYPQAKNRGVGDWLDRHKGIKHFLKKILRIARYDLAEGKRKRAENVTGALAWFDTIVPIGIRVSPKAPSDTIDKIIAELKTEEFEGKPVLRLVTRREELFSGPHVHMAPEIIILPEHRFMVYGLREPNIIAPLVGTRTRKGDHNAAINAVFMACGPAVVGRQRDLNIKIYDVFATIMKLYGIMNAPSDGTPIDLS